jgi:hypothetical protein
MTVFVTLLFERGKIEEDFSVGNILGGINWGYAGFLCQQSNPYAA